MAVNARTGDQPVAQASGGRVSPTTVFFIIAFAIPWAGWLVLALADVHQPWVVQALFFTGDACSVAGLAARYYASGRTGVIDLLRSAINFRASVSWWLYALGLPLILQVCMRSLYGTLNGGIGHIEAASVTGFVSLPILFLLLTGPLGEEFGWRGYLLPRLLQSRPVLWASIVLGVVWAFWHTPLYYANWLAVPWKGPEFFLIVVCYSILIAALYIGSRGNLLLCILMHWMFNAAPQVGKKMFPDIKDQGLDFAEVRLVVMIVAVGLVVACFRSWMLKRIENPLQQASASLG